MISAAEYQSFAREADFMAAVRQYAETLGYLCWHFPRAIGNPCVPDLFLFRDGNLVLAELKTERGRLSPRQVAMLLDLDAHGVTVEVWKPSDWPCIEKMLKGEE